MTVRQFVPSVWHAAILTPYNTNLIFAQMGVVNRDYEGDISAFGDNVRVNTIGDPTISTYTTNTDMSDPETLDDAQTVLTITESKSFSFQIDDVDRRQANVDFRTAAMSRAAYQLAKTMDQFVAGEMGSDVGTDLYADAAAASAIGTEGKAYDYITEFQEVLDSNDVPDDGRRFIIVPPFFIKHLRQDGNVVASGAEAADVRQLNGMITRLAGINILRSNNVISNGTDYHIIAGHPDATTIAEQISSIEAYRMEKRFADGIKGLHLYGAKVVRPQSLIGGWIQDPNG